MRILALLLLAPQEQAAPSWAAQVELAAKAWSVVGGDKPKAVQELAALLEPAREWKSADEARQDIELLDAHKRLFDSEKSLQPILRKHHLAYFEKAFAAADGPGTFEELRKFCAQNKLDEGKTKLEVILANLRPGKPSGDFARRAQQRSNREQARRVVFDFMRTRAQSTAAEIQSIVDWLKQEQYGPSEAQGKLNDLVRRLLDWKGDAAKRLVSAITALEHSPETKLDDKKFQARVSKVVKDLTDRLMLAVEKCLGVGEAGLGFELFMYLLKVDPQNKRARSGLGQMLVGEKWLRPYEAEQFRAGISWDDRFGWTLTKEAARYEKGEVFDFETKKWDTLEKANAYHANNATPWKLRSEHFELVSTADLALSAEVLKRLEAFFLQAFAEYDLFFAKGAKGANLIFGVAPVQKRLLVNFWRDAAQFKAHANPPTNWAAGFYSGGQHASFFYAFDGKVSTGVLQHELTHQILGEYSGGGMTPSWLAEGAAVFLEAAAFQDGVLTLPPLEKHGRLNQYARNAKDGGPEHTFKAMMGFKTGKDWDAGDIGKNYRGAGAVVYFLMSMDRGRYRGDFIEMLRDAYNGSGRSPEEYFGLSIESLEFLMKRFYTEIER